MSSNRLALVALVLLATSTVPARAQHVASSAARSRAPADHEHEPDPAEALRALDWRSALERVNERIRSSPIAWLDGHLGVSSMLRLSPDGARVVTWAQDGSTWLWNAWTGEPIGLLGMFGMGETSTPSSQGVAWPVLEFSSDGERVLVHEPLAGFAGLWDGRSAEFLGYLEVDKAFVLAARFTPDGRRVAVASDNGLVRFFDAGNGVAIDTPVLEADCVAELSFSPDGARLLARTFHDRGFLWDAASGALQAELGSDELPLCIASFSADSTRVLGVSADRVALVYSLNLPAGTTLESTVVRSHDDSWIIADWGTGGHLATGIEIQAQPSPVCPRGDRLVVVTARHETVLWDPAKNELVAELDGADLDAKSTSWVGFSPDGERLLTISKGHGKLWSASSGAFVADLPFAANHAVFGRSGRYFAAATSSLAHLSRYGAVYDTHSGRFVGGLELEYGTVFGLHFSDTDRFAATSAYAFSAVWDASREPLTLEGHTLQIAEEGIDPGFAKWSPSGDRIVTPAWGRRTWFTDRLWDTHTGATVRDLPTQVFSGGGFAGGGALISLLRAGTVSVISVTDGGPAAKAGILPGDRVVRFAGKKLNVNGALATAVLEAPSKTTVAVLRAGKELELPVEFPTAEDGSAMGNKSLGMEQRNDVQVELQEPESGAIRSSVLLQGVPCWFFHQATTNRDATRLLLRQRHLAALFDLTDGRKLADIRTVDAKRATTYDSMLHLVAMSPAGDVVAVAQAKRVLLWTEASSEDSAVLQGDVLDLEFSHDGSLLAGASTSGAVLVWNVAERKLAHRLEGHAGDVRFVGFDTSGQRIVSAGSDGTARIWDLAGARAPIVVEGHAGLLNRPSFSPDGARLVTIADDATARLWDANTGALIAVLEGHVAPVIYGSFSPDGARLLTQARDGSSRIWNVGDGRLLATRVEYDDGWVMFEPGGYFAAGGTGAEHAQMVIDKRRYPLSSYAAIYESPERVAESLAGKKVRAPSFVPQAPQVTVASPLDPLVPERSFRLEVLIEDTYGIESVSVVQDGRALDAQWIGDHIVASGKKARLSCDLALPEGANETTIKLRATNARKIQSAPQTIFVRWQPPQRELYLLALGVADYRDDKLDLAYPVKDVDDLIARLTAEEGGYYKRVHTQRLVNGDVTPGRLRKVREEFLLRAQPEDTIVIFAAGHGVRSGSGEYYFLTPGTTPSDPYDGIERQTLESLVTWDRLHAKRRILLLDTCQSGETFGEGTRGVATDAFDQTAVNEAAGAGLYIIAASSERGFAQEMRGNGLFTRCLLEGLDGAADRDRDGLVGIDELKTYATTTVHQRSGGRQRPTAPRIEGGEDFPVSRVRR